MSIVSWPQVQRIVDALRTKTIVRMLLRTQTKAQLLNSPEINVCKKHVCEIIGSTNNQRGINHPQKLAVSLRAKPHSLTIAKYWQTFIIPTQNATLPNEGTIA